MNRSIQPRADLLGALEDQFSRMHQAALEAGLTPGGDIECYHNGELVSLTPNLIPAAWRSKLLRAGYAGGAQVTSFYIAPYQNEVDVEALDTLTMAQFEATLDEFTAYDETTRPVWAQDVEANQAIANATTLAKITVNATGTIWGIILCTNNAKGNAAGDLCAATTFGAKRDVQAGDTLEFKYTMRMNLPA